MQHVLYDLHIGLFVIKALALFRGGSRIFSQGGGGGQVAQSAGGRYGGGAQWPTLRRTQENFEYEVL